MLRHTLDGKTLLTIDQLAERYGMTPSSFRSVLARENEQRAADGREPVPVADHCGRMALYDPRLLDKIVKGRPGKGSRR